jgi:hypothetical protein
LTDNHVASCTYISALLRCPVLLLLAWATMQGGSRGGRGGASPGWTAAVPSCRKCSLPKHGNADHKTCVFNRQINHLHAEGQVSVGK